MERGVKAIRLIVPALAFLAVFFASAALASTTDGTISGYAWSSKIGWINFGCANCNAHITDSQMTGYAWSGDYGWIYLHPTTGGVHNTTAGVLSGYAWNPNVGWLDFTGVTVNSSGAFGGQGTGDNFGTVNFACANCNLTTDWRPSVSRPACNNSADDDGDGKTDYPSDPGCESLTDTDETDAGGGGFPSGSGSSPTPPFKIVINNDAGETNSRTTTLNLYFGADAAYVWLSEDNTFRQDVYRVDCPVGQMATDATFTLSAGEGVKYIYAKFCTSWGHCSDTYSDSIFYKIIPTPPLPQVTPTSTVTPVARPEGAPLGPAVPAKPGEEIFSWLKENLLPIVSVLPESLKNLIGPAPTLPSFGFLTDELWPALKAITEKLIKPTPSIAELVPKHAPLAMRGLRWELVDPKAVQRFVFAPLPKEFIALENKFPTVGKLLAQAGVKRMQDSLRLQAAQLLLPGPSRSLGVSTTTLAEGYKLPRAVPVNELPAFLKKKVPSDIVFASGASGLVDFSLVLTLSDQGKPEQRIVTISGKPLSLSVRPDAPVKKVRGYVVFKSRQQKSSSLRFPLAELFSSLIFTEPALATPSEPSELETKLVLAEFEYTDEDKDGIYTASITSPVPAGEYEIITVMDYEDVSLGSKEIRLVAVVDPEGYVFADINGQELRLRGAIVSLYWLDPETKQYLLWPAKEYQQENPQVTDARGSYSFLVPEGVYYLTASVPGYSEYQGQSFDVVQGAGVHFNLEMKPRDWWLKYFDWRTLVLFLLLMLLLYNFYRDRKRERKNRPAPPAA